MAWTYDESFGYWVGPAGERARFDENYGNWIAPSGAKLMLTPSGSMETLDGGWWEDIASPRWNYGSVEGQPFLQSLDYILNKPVESATKRPTSINGTPVTNLWDVAIGGKPYIATGEWGGSSGAHAFPTNPLNVSGLPAGSEYGAIFAPDTSFFLRDYAQDKDEKTTFADMIGPALAIWGGGYLGGLGLESALGGAGGAIGGAADAATLAGGTAADTLGTAAAVPTASSFAPQTVAGSLAPASGGLGAAVGVPAADAGLGLTLDLLGPSGAIAPLVPSGFTPATISDVLSGNVSLPPLPSSATTPSFAPQTLADALAKPPVVPTPPDAGLQGGVNDWGAAIAKGGDIAIPGVTTGVGSGLGLGLDAPLGLANIPPTSGATTPKLPSLPTGAGNLLGTSQEDVQGEPAYSPTALPWSINWGMPNYQSMFGSPYLADNPSLMQRLQRMKWRP